MYKYVKVRLFRIMIDLNIKKDVHKKRQTRIIHKARIFVCMKSHKDKMYYIFSILLPVELSLFRALDITFKSEKKLQLLLSLSSFSCFSWESDKNRKKS